ncbi:MAG: hypothetical protein E4H01_15880 [Lysobacterales bacterium]|nr:MAG: hypothetical protein E4H01_15880 [Xanthomonadales bacterium]
MSLPKLPTPLDQVVTSEGYITPPWYQYFLAADFSVRTRVNLLTTATTAEYIPQGQVTVFASTPGVIHTLEDPEIGNETLLICSIGTTQAGSVTVRAATDVAIGPSGQTAFVFNTSASTYEYVKLLGASTSQYHILYRTTAVSVAASS